MTANESRNAEQPIRLGDASLEHLRVSGVFDAENTEAFVEGVAAINNLRVIRRDGQIILTAR